MHTVNPVGLSRFFHLLAVLAGEEDVLRPRLFGRTLRQAAGDQYSERWPSGQWGRNVLPHEQDPAHLGFTLPPNLGIAGTSLPDRAPGVGRVLPRPSSPTPLPCGPFTGEKNEAWRDKVTCLESRA